jgi:ABC-type lipoprotein export system ATPase subunit
MIKSSMPIVSVKDLKKSYLSPNGNQEPILDVPSFELHEKQQVAMRGASGSGKTTFLHLLAGIIRPDEGQIAIDGQTISALKEHQRDILRAGKIGYIFQSFNLLKGFNCLENVRMAMDINGRVDRGRALELLESVGLADRQNHLPDQLSMGQQQRVAIARALVNQPKVVLADEPTGNLDPANTDYALSLLCSLCAEWGSSLILVSHDPRVIEQFDDPIDWEELNQVQVGHPFA